MCVRYNGATSDDQDIPGGGPQGGLLTVIFFDLQVNLAGAPCPTLPLLPPLVPGPEPDPHQAGPLPLCHQPEITLKKKYVLSGVPVLAQTDPHTRTPFYCEVYAEDRIYFGNQYF